MIAARARVMVSAAALAVAGVGASLLWAFDPSAPGSLFPKCIFRVVTGLYCPGCGMTRMLHALVHGDLARAASMNALALAGLPVIAAIVLEDATGRRLVHGRLRAIAYNGPLWIGAALVFGVLRNLPWAPFTALAPG